MKPEKEREKPVRYGIMPIALLYLGCTVALAVGLGGTWLLKMAMSLLDGLMRHVMPD